MTFDWGAVISIKTIYLMGSVKNNDDLIGMEMTILGNGSQTSCPTVDGSGFYSCSAVGRYLMFSKPELGSKFTICDVAIYESENLTPLISDTDMSAVYESTSVNPSCSCDSGNVVVDHPIYFGIATQC